MNARLSCGVALLVLLAVACAGARAAAQSCTQLTGVYSSTVLGTTSGASGSCGGADAPEAIYFYFAPRAGTYVVDTVGSEIDTVLYIRNDTGTELGCNDDVTPGSVTQSRLTLSLTAGQMVTIVVDGFSTARCPSATTRATSATSWQPRSPERRRAPRSGSAPPRAATAATTLRTPRSSTRHPPPAPTCCQPKARRSIPSCPRVWEPATERSWRATTISIHPRISVRG
jgi:hypothetical protein